MNHFLAAVSTTEIAQFCQRWLIRELAVFGSAARGDFSPNSDVDVLVSFAAEADWGLLEHVQMQLELQTLFQRNVDLISKRALERSPNWALRDEILSKVEILFPRREVMHATG